MPERGITALDSTIKKINMVEKKLLVAGGTDICT